MKIPVKEAIESGAWFNCRTKKYAISDEEIHFKLKVLSFEKINMEEVDEPHKIKLDEGVLWLMKIEVVNLEKEEVSPFDITYRILLIDQDGFKFREAFDRHLQQESRYGEINGLSRFAGGPDLKPKIKAKGAIAFLLPDDDDAEYFLSIEYGDIVEA